MGCLCFIQNKRLGLNLAYINCLLHQSTSRHQETLLCVFQFLGACFHPDESNLFGSVLQAILNQSSRNHIFTIFIMNAMDTYIAVCSAIIIRSITMLLWLFFLSPYNVIFISDDISKINQHFFMLCSDHNLFGCRELKNIFQLHVQLDILHLL